MTVSLGRCAPPLFREKGISSRPAPQKNVMAITKIRFLDVTARLFDPVDFM